MKILPMTNNQQNVDKSKNPNFGAFRCTNSPKTLHLVKVLLQEDGFPLSAVLRKGENIVETSGLTTIGQHLNDEQIARYLKRNPHTRLEKSDIAVLTASFGNFASIPEQIAERLDLILKKAPRLTFKKLLEVLPAVTEARMNLRIAQNEAKIKLGF